MGERLYCTYIMASRRNGTLYVGITGDLVRGVWEHREGVVAGFTRQYRVKHLAWYEPHEDVAAAILREKQGMEAGLEIAIDRRRKPRMARPLPDVAVTGFRPAPE